MQKYTNLFDLDPVSMEIFFNSIDEKSFRASQAIKWVHQHGVTDFEHMTNFSLSLREKLSKIACIKPLTIESEQISCDGTHKWLIRIDDENSVETVYIPENDRGTLCISSQIGCPLDCSFCSTARQGFNRNLTVAEIIGQVWIAYNALGYFDTRQRIISNIVLMGMGEPLLNFDNVIKAIRLMTDDLAYGLSRKRVTLSTSGVIPGIKKLGETINVSLAVSLHAPENKLRNILVPLNRKYPVDELISACMEYSKARYGNPVTFEYVMLDGINDSEVQARLLVKLLRDVPSKVNLIPFNPFPGTDYRCSSSAVIDRFRNILVNAGIITITRKTRGDDIDAACGQLVGKVMPSAMRYQVNQMESTV